jgi:hypothetical protein
VVLAINPVTLGTLTWVSCFSYVQGTTLALVALLAFRRGQMGDGLGFLAGGLAYLAALECSHEVLFLPAVFIALSWLERVARPVWPGLCVSVVCTAVGLAVSHFGYGFDRFGVDGRDLLTPGFVIALSSSILSLAASLGLAYAVSFFGSTTTLVQICLNEAVRWIVTVGALAWAAFRWRPTRAWRLHLCLLVAFGALITPYVIRLYLTPDTVRYDPRYLLAGRVFYPAFAVLALLLGELLAPLYARPAAAWMRWMGWAAPLLAYGYALLFAYAPRHFLGFEVHLGPPPDDLPRWNPYEHDSVATGVVAGVALLAILAVRVWSGISRRPSREPD